MKACALCAAVRQERRSMTKRVQIVPHFHWDREWYFTTEESQLLLVNDMAEILDRLEQDPGYPCFVLDGQTAVLEDYFAVMPQAKERVRALVRQGRLIIGPWYTQTDEMVVGGESIARNLLYGKLDCAPFGDRMRIGYLPDSFGQSARMPQLLNEFGITRSIFWRGTSERMGTDKTEFLWRGDDGAEVTVQLMPLGYAIGKYLPAEPGALKTRLDKYWPVLDKGNTTGVELLPNGHDQMPIQQNIFEVMAQIEALYPDRTCTIGRYEDVFAAIDRGRATLPVLHGEFLDGKYMRVHRSIYSTRADLKSANTRIENKLTNLVEPLAAMAASLGYAYPHGQLEKIWKELLKNHAHDSMGCCCSDKVHALIRGRYSEAELRADELLRFTMRKMTDTMPCDRALDKLAVFNLLPQPRSAVFTAEIVTRMKGFTLSDAVDAAGTPYPFRVLKTEIVDPGLIDRQIVHYENYDPFVRYTVELEAELPAMGCRTFLIRESDAPLAAAPPQPADALENEWLRVTVAANGTLAMLDKATGQRYENLLLLEDGGDDGDEYDYSPAPEDWVLTSADRRAAREILHTAKTDTARVTVTMPVPADLAERAAHRCSGRVEATFSLTLRKGGRVLEVSAEVENQARDHRLRVLLPGNSANTAAVADNQFGSIRRAAVDPALAVWQQEGWSERPDAIYPFLSFVHGDGAHTVAALTNSVREYELTGPGHGTLAVTLFRGVGLLGKENLLRRPGRPSGIRMETPDSQMLGRWRFDFALTPDCAHCGALARAYLTPVQTYNKMPFNAMKLNVPNQNTPYRFSLLAIDNPAVTMTAVKEAEESGDTIVRLCNMTQDAQPYRLQSIADHVARVRMDEETVAAAGGAEQGVLTPNQVVTLRLHGLKHR